MIDYKKVTFPIIKKKTYLVNTIKNVLAILFHLLMIETLHFHKLIIRIIYKRKIERYFE